MTLPGYTTRTRPLRVLMTLDCVGGVWRFGMDLARGLSSQAVEFVFLVMGPAPSAEQEREAAAIGKLVHRALPLDWLAEKAADLEAVPGVIAEVARAEKVDLIHLNLPTQAAGLVTDRPVVVMSHSCIPTWFAGVKGMDAPDGWRWHKDLNRKGFDRADQVLAPSASHADLMVRTYGPIRNLAVIHNAAPTPINRTDGAERNGVFAVARWWDEAKNAATLDHASAMLASRITMIGRNVGPNGEHVRIRHAWHAGALSHAQTLKALATAKVFVSPSRYEPFGLAALEAASLGAALVLADIATYRELWDGAAVFVPPTDPQACADAIATLMADDALCRRLAGLAAARAERFAPVAQASAMRQAYDALVATELTLNVG